LVYEDHADSNTIMNWHAGGHIVVVAYFKILSVWRFNPRRKSDSVSEIEYRT